MIGSHPLLHVVMISCCLTFLGRETRLETLLIKLSCEMGMTESKDST